MSEQQHRALVTGASRGIGRSIAEALKAAGCTVTGTATSQAGAEAIAERGCTGGVLQLGDAAALESQFAELSERAGPFDVLINNAAITDDDLAMRLRPEKWRSVIEVNLNGTFALTRMALRGMIKARWGRIVNISSVVGSIANPGQANYAASKAGIEAVTRTLAAELGSRGITVNAVAPGFIETDMTAGLSEEQRGAMLSRVLLGRFGTPEEVAHCVQFLCSDDAAYITGQVLHVNGGMHV
ncbi:MAG: 3-oxoacyl-ACP reductase FabG [Gammaproteobacteria bacterium AqS3]|nr:3-oxoacyl-ACP reductase FabG [Gammaproteobacteria bacterium AqS3]